MSLIPQNLKAAPRRHARMVIPYDSELGYGGLALTINGVTTCHHVRPVPSDLGDGLALEREDTGEVHVVELADEGCQCSCRSFRYGRGSCKHLDAVRALRDAGRL